MQKFKVQRVQAGYRGESAGLSIELPSLAVQTTADSAGISIAWIFLGLYMFIFFSVFVAMRMGLIDSFAGALVLIVMVTLMALVFGKRRLGRGFGQPDRVAYSLEDVEIPEGKVVHGERRQRPHQRVVIGEECTRETFRDGSDARTRSAFEYQKSATLAVRGDHLMTFWLCFPSGEERILFVDVEADERERIEPALREELGRLG